MLDKRWTEPSNIVAVTALLLSVTGCAGDGEAVATWTVAPGQLLEDDTASFTALVTRRGCNSGVTGEVNAPRVEETDDAVTITFTVSPGARGRGLPQQRCDPLRGGAGEPSAGAAPRRRRLRVHGGQQHDRLRPGRDPIIHVTCATQRRRQAAEPQSVDLHVFATRDPHPGRRCGLTDP